MIAARKTWIPGGHEGSQRLSSGALKLLNAGIQNVIDAEHEEWLSENEDDDVEYIDE
jgi:hypothetical protein